MAEEQLSQPSVIVSLLDLPAVHRTLAGMDEAAILEVARSAERAECGGWFARARAIGELQRRSDYKDAAVIGYAKRLEMGKTLAFELAAIDRKILLPRLREEGDAATFPIREKRFYALACKLAPTVRKSPLAILKIAEDGRIENARYSTTRLKERLGVKDQVDPTKGLGKCLVKMATLERKARQRFARAVAKDRNSMIEMAKATAQNATLLVEDLMALPGESE